MIWTNSYCRRCGGPYEHKEILRGYCLYCFPDVIFKDRPAHCCTWGKQIKWPDGKIECMDCRINNKIPTPTIKDYIENSGRMQQVMMGIMGHRIPHQDKNN